MLYHSFSKTKDLQSGQSSPKEDFHEGELLYINGSFFGPELTLGQTQLYRTKQSGLTYIFHRKDVDKRK